MTGERLSLVQPQPTISPKARLLRALASLVAPRRAGADWFSPDRVARRLVSIRRRADESSVRVAWQALWCSRLVVLLAGVLGVLSFGRAPNTQAFDPRHMTTPFGYFGNLLVSPFARWDSVWYLTIAHSGYDHQLARTEFFPVYPFLMRCLGWVISSDLVAGILISLVSFAVALVLLYRLAALELGASAARACLLLMAFFPMAWTFSAVYNESLFLALSLGCILKARSGQWFWAGVLGALASATRPEGVLLVVPLVLMLLYGPRMDRIAVRGSRTGLARLAPPFRLSREAGWVLLVPVGFGAYLLALKLAGIDPLSPFHAHRVWFRHFAGPFGGVWDGAVAAWDGLRQLLHGPAPPVYFKVAGGDPLIVGEQNLVLFGFLVAAMIALVGVFRRLPVAYGAYAVAILALPLSYPVTPQPLQSISRYVTVVFPLFMWGGWWISKRRAITPAVAVSAVLLGLFTAQFATWRFVG